MPLLSTMKVLCSLGYLTDFGNFSWEGFLSFYLTFLTWKNVILLFFSLKSNKKKNNQQLVYLWNITLSIEGLSGNYFLIQKGLFIYLLIYFKEETDLLVNNEE